MGANDPRGVANLDPKGMFGTTKHCYILNIQALGLMVSEKEVFFHVIHIIRQKKKICVFPVTRPTLIFPSDPKVFIGIPKKKRNFIIPNLPYLRPFLLVLPLSLSYLKLYCCLNTCFD